MSADTTVDTLIDTNVLVYIYDVTAPKKQRRALEIVGELITSRRAALPAQVLAEFFVAVTRKIAKPLSPVEALERIDNYSRCTTVTPLTAPVVREAVRGVLEHGMSYWDAQIWAAARLNQIPLIITEDMPGQNYIEGVRYVNPFE